ncbi:MAG: glutamate synthase-related protein [Tissierella sp.]|uniref:glutamate synthase-related protein n=1 Tax=Tissierella sp. TaxID=41274 RepID=UPI003F9597D3
MSFSPVLGTSITNTKLRTPEYVSPFSGMCAVCTENCLGPCEIGLSATRGDEATNPYKSDVNQFASQKNYPLDFSHFNINGRVFGATNCDEDPFLATFPKANLNTYFGIKNKIKLKTPVILPALAKLNWQDYFAGAALAGTIAFIGESVVDKDPGVIFEDGKVSRSPLIEDMVNAFRKYYHGYGNIVLQANYDDEYLGVLDYAIEKLNIKSVEIKFGQAAKGIQGFGRLDSIEKALMFQKRGHVVYPDPSDPIVAENYKNGIGQPFQKIGKLPMWNEDILVKRVAKLRELGAKRITFKTGPYDPKDLIKIIKIASKAGVDLITFDGGGGGTGHSPAKMMNEWGIPTVYMESLLYDILSRFKEKAYSLPQIAIAGGFTMEDSIYKGLALGAPFVDFIAVGRGNMAAAFVGKQVEDSLKKGRVPKDYKRFGESKEEIFSNIKQLKEIYGDKATDIPGGAIGVYSYINRISTGLRQFMALNRKFELKDIDRSDIIPMTDLAAKVSGLPTFNDLVNKELKSI